MGGYSSDKRRERTFNLSERPDSERVSENVMPDFNSSFMLVFFRRHLPAVALLQSWLAAGGDALNSAVCVSARAAPVRAVCVCGACAIRQRPEWRHLVRSGVPRKHRYHCPSCTIGCNIIPANFNQADPLKQGELDQTQSKVQNCIQTCI